MSTANTERKNTAGSRRGSRIDRIKRECKQLSKSKQLDFKYEIYDDDINWISFNIYSSIKHGKKTSRLGWFNVLIKFDDIDDMKDPYDITINDTIAVESLEYDSIAHPHIEDGDICLGNQTFAVYEHMLHRELKDLVNLFKKFMKAYNEKNVFFTIDEVLNTRSRVQND